MRSLSVTHVMLNKGVWQHVRMPLTPKSTASAGGEDTRKGPKSTRRVGLDLRQDSKETNEDTFVVR